MTRPKNQPPSDVAASVKARLLRIARTEGEDFNSLLIRYVLERLLHRLSVSTHADAFLLKGAVLFTVWSNRPHRATKDVDLLGFGDPDPARLAAVVAEICATAVEDDGLKFNRDTIEAAPIREDAVYDGVRVKLVAFLGAARVPVQIDVGFGDSTEPAPVQLEVPTLLGHSPPSLRGYRKEVTIAEKFHAMVDLGMNNSRMKDYFDIWFIAEHFDVDSADLGLAIRSTFMRRQTPIPRALPIGLTSEFAESREKLAQWNAFVRRTRLSVDAPSLADAVERIATFLNPILAEITSESTS